MASTILKSTSKESEILGKDWYGEFQLFCSVYTDSPVQLQCRNPQRGEETPWLQASFNGKDIVFEKAGAVLDFRLTRGFEYRLITANAGAEIDIDKHNPHGT